MNIRNILSNKKNYKEKKEKYFSFFVQKII